MEPFRKRMMQRIKAAAAFSVMLLMVSNQPVLAMDAGMVALSSQTAQQPVKLDISGGRVSGLNNAYDFRVPIIWKDNVIAERNMIGNPSYVLDRIDFSCLSVTRVYKPRLLMSLYVIDKSKWSDSLPYTPLLISKDYIFCVALGVRGVAFPSEFDQAMYRACSQEISTLEAIRNRITLSKEQALWRELTVFVNGTELDMPVIIIDGTYYLPMRAVCEALGYTVTWSSTSQFTTIKKGNFVDRIPARPNMVTDSRGYKMRLIENRTYVSVAYLYNVFRTIIEIDDAKNVYVISQN